MKRKERVRRLLEKVNRLDEEGQAQFEKVVDRLLHRQKEDRTEQQEQHQSTNFRENTPWRAKGGQVVDCEGNLVAKAVNKTDARLLATAPRLAATVWMFADWHRWTGGRACTIGRDFRTWWDDVRSMLIQAGEGCPELPEDKMPETPIEWAHEHLATMTRAWNKLWSALALWPQTDRCRVIPECKRKRIAGHMRAMVGQQDKIRMELEP